MDRAKPVRPRHAASLVLTRSGPDGLEVLMGRRPRRSAFAPDVFVFPGGGVEPHDFDAAPLRPLAAACAVHTGAPPKLAAALAAAALRETEEETGQVVPDDHGALTLLARAITPTNSPIRFHARFFHTQAEPTLGAHADSPELSDLGFRPLPEAAKLPLMDVTEAILAALGQPERRPFVYSYRHGRPFRRWLA